MFALIIALLSSISLAFAYYVEYALNIKPCVLCVYQRIPYYLLLITSVVHYFLIRRNISRRFIAYLYFVLFLSSATLAVYHVSVEKGLITHEACASAKTSPGATIEDIKKQIYQNTSSCNQVAFSIFGVSMAEMNALFSIIAMGLTIRYRKAI